MISSSINSQLYSLYFVSISTVFTIFLLLSLMYFFLYTVSRQYFSGSDMISRHILSAYTFGIYSRNISVLLLFCLSFLYMYFSDGDLSLTALTGYLPFHYGGPKYSEFCCLKFVSISSSRRMNVTGFILENSSPRVELYLHI